MARKLGLKPTNHSDVTVTPIDPIFTIWTAVNRVSRSGQVIGSSESTTPYLALQAIKIFAACQLLNEKLKETLTTGKLVDVVILDENPLKVKPMEIKNIQILERIKEVKTIFKK